jgi:lambda repressor-like predicted transcriptional regulator
MKLFPIMAKYGGHAKVKTTDYIPFEVLIPHKEQAFKNHGQTLERLAERGGLSYAELLDVLKNQCSSSKEFPEQQVAKREVYQIIQELED